jgi:two-component system sensor histidine kinase CssS
MKDLKVAHNILLKSQDFTKLNRFDELDNLKGSDHFIVNLNEDSKTYIMDIGKMKDNNFIENKGLPKPPDKNDLKDWMCSFVKGEMNESEFKEVYNNKKFTFIISSIEKSGQTLYLISYIPSIEDDNILYIAILIAIVFIAIGFITAKVVANYISRPLKKLEDHSKKIAHKDWKEPISIKSEDEIGRLAEAMNFMQTELKRIDEEEKLFLQSISHDLKTPVMVIMSHAEAIIDGIYVDTVEKTAEIIKDEAINLEKKIKQLLFLNTLDYVLENNNENTDVNLNELLSRIIGRFEVINSTIEWELDVDKVIIKGNSDKIQVSIENILENGLRYAETKISVKLKLEENFAILDIYNDGPNISTKSIHRIFENLYKDKTGNFGLGLAITKKIVDFHKGEIKAVNRDKGVSFIIKYPV